MPAERRRAIGVLRRFPDRTKYLATKYGHMWQLDVDDTGMLGLVGLTVQVKGRQSGNLIIVEGIEQA